jgi:hypothetical protein
LLPVILSNPTNTAMKKTLLFIATCLSINMLKSQTPSFTITCVPGTYVLTCSQTSLDLYATSSFSSVGSYSWISANSTLTGSHVVLTNPGNYTVAAIGGAPNQIFTIVTNTFAPGSSITPTLQNITCNPSSITNVTLSTYITANMSHYIISPHGASVTANTQTVLYTPGTPGTYTHVVIDNLNGCSSQNTFTVTSASGFPTYSLTSPQNFTLGCGTKSVAVINIINAQTNPIPGGPVSFTLIGPSTSTGFPGSSYSINIPGTWTAIVKDNTSLCEASTPFSVVQNTFGPSLSVSVPTQVLDCNTMQTTLQGSSSTPNVSYEWKFIGVPGSFISSSISVNANTIAPTPTLVNTYTFIVTDNNSTCKSSTIVPIYQNLYKPNAAISNGGSNAITCLTPSIVLTNVSTTGIPSGPFPNSQPVIGFAWAGPTTSGPASTYTALVPGIYTMTAKDLNNGCTKQATIVVNDNRDYPIITGPSAPYDLCANTTVILSPTIIPGSSLTYTWTYPSTATVTGQNSSALTTNAAGLYSLSVTNTSNGCISNAQMTVGICVGIENVTQKNTAFTLYPNPSNGSFSISSGKQQGNVKVIVYNALGMIIKQQALLSEKEMIDIRHESAGIYIVQIYVDDDLAYSSRLIKQ